MSGTADTIVEVVTVETSTLTVDVVLNPPVQAIDVVAPPSVVAVEVVDFAGPPIGYPQLPEELRQLPIAFPFLGRPAAGATVNIPMGFAVTVPLDFAGARTWADVIPTGDAVFAFNRLANGTSTPLGSVTLTPQSQTSHTASGPGGRVEAGEVLQIVSPRPQDLTLSDIGITLMVNRI